MCFRGRLVENLFICSKKSFIQTEIVERRVTIRFLCGQYMRISVKIELSLLKIAKYSNPVFAMMH